MPCNAAVRAALSVPLAACSVVGELGQAHASFNASRLDILALRPSIRCAADSGFGFLEPVLHAHLAVELRSGGEILARLVAVVGPGV